MCCEKCWEDAYIMSLSHNKSQGECYSQLLKERQNAPCTPQEQAGQFWDDELKRDKREVEG